MDDIGASHLPSAAHVPPELVRPYQFITGAKTKTKPHSFIAAMHEGPDIFWGERAYQGIQGAWIPRKREDLERVHTDHEHFSAREATQLQKLIGRDIPLIPAEADPPKHQLYRMMFNPVFAPSRMAALEDKIRQYARNIIGGFRDRGGCEFVSDFAFEFPILVFLELMGLPQDEARQFVAWERSLVHESDVERLSATMRNIVDYLEREIAKRRVSPRDDLITYGINAEYRGTRLDEAELLGFCFLLFLGGLDTVSVNMAFQFLHLAEHPGHQATLRARPEMIPDAIEEMMRAYAAVVTSRECIKETTIAGASILPGDRVMLATFVVGRDPDTYPDPGTVILDRKPRHIGFGFGPHVCIGIHLARREMRIALEEFLSIVPPFQLKPNAEIEYYLGTIVQPVTVPLVWEG